MKDRPTTERRLAGITLGLLALTTPACEAPEHGPQGQPDSLRRGGREDTPEPPHGTNLPAPANVAVLLLDRPTSDPQDRSELSAVLVNTGRDVAQAEVFAVALGLDGQEARLSLGVVELEPEQQVEVTVPVTEIPVQTVGHAGQMRFEALVDRGEGVLVPSRSERVFLDYPEDFGTGLVYDANGAVARNALLEEQSGDAPDQLMGRFLDPSGAWRDLHASDATQGPMRWTPSRRIPRDVIPPEPPAGTTTRACGMWMSAYVDDEVGEDLLTAPAFEVSWARYASASIRPKAGGAPIWSGHLNADGCAPALELDPGDYKLLLRSSFLGPQGQAVDVLYNYLVPDGLQGEYVTTFDLGFNVDPVWGSTQLNLYTSNNEVTNIAAIISTVLGRADNGLPSAAYTIHSNIDCPGIPGNACAPGTEMYVGTGPGGTSDDEWKFVIAHELGHNAQSVATGIPGTYTSTYDTIIDTQAACRCDHVTVANQLHCLQSLEHVSKAQTEGFAQYFAARSFNTQGSDCAFAYYKEFLYPAFSNGSPYDLSAFPPVPIDCATPHQWRSTHCSDIEDSGTELDWLTAFRALEMGGVTLEEIYAVYDEACGGGSCGSTTVRWNDLADAASVFYGSPSHPKALLFAQVGSLHDVD
ncbi:MAG: hypothetical protein KUG77_05485 [Nannocystaceae bacterium]|nr:hypothetical protein [Nannocystaceae bacterium]